MKVDFCLRQRGIVGALTSMHVCVCERESFWLYVFLSAEKKMITAITLVSGPSPTDSPGLTPPRGERIRQSAGGMKLCGGVCV